jgi:WD40 repeat protein
MSNVPPVKRLQRLEHAVLLLILLIASPGPARAEDQAGANFDREPEKANAPGFVSNGTIDLSSLGKGSWVSKLSFSPDRQYLAILVSLDLYKTDLIIWDLNQSKIQTIINAPNMIGLQREVEPVWSLDGTVIVCGCGSSDAHNVLSFWDPLTGHVINTLDLFLVDLLRYNQDGSKLFVGTILGTRSPRSRANRIYNPVTWTYKEIADSGIELETACWTEKGQLLLFGVWPERQESATIGGVTVNAGDVVAESVDPVTGYLNRAVVLASGRVNRFYPQRRLPDESTFPIQAVPNFASHTVALGDKSVRVLDSDTLATLYVYPNPKTAADNDTISDVVYSKSFSPDGKFLFLAANSFTAAQRGCVLDAATGETVSTFSGGRGESALSSDGKELAIADGQIVRMIALSR